MKFLHHFLILGLIVALGGAIAITTTSNSTVANAATKSHSCKSQPHQRKCSTTSGKHRPSAKPKPTSNPMPTASPKPTTTRPTPKPSETPAKTPASTPTAAPAAPPVSTVNLASSDYPLHTNVVSTTFWVGEIFDASLEDGSQVCSTYDGQWAFSHTGVKLGTVSSNADGCPGSVFGGCDGVSSGTGTNFSCKTERRDASNGYFPKSQPTPLENPFYLDLPFDDLNDSTAFKQRCQVIPWAAADNAATGVNHCADSNYSYMKNRWVEITGPNGNVCYGQIEDAGPSSGSLYHDANYVFSKQDARPANKEFSGDATQGAGMDVSPALNGCLGFADLDGDNDRVSWRFVDAANVPAGPWLNVVTTAGVKN